MVGNKMSNTKDPHSEKPLSSISTQTSEHYAWGGVCDGWHLLNEKDLSVIQERVPPAASETRHKHSKARQFFYVLNGAASMEINGQSISMTKGQGLHVPPGVSHRFVNDSSETVHFLVISSPSTRGDRIDS